MLQKNKSQQNLNSLNRVAQSDIARNHALFPKFELLVMSQIERELDLEMLWLFYCEGALQGAEMCLTGLKTLL